MKFSVISLAVSSLVLFTGCDSPKSTVQEASPHTLSAEPATQQNGQALPSAQQSDIDNIASTLDVSYRLITNVPSEKCVKDKADGKCFEVELSFTAKEAIKVSDWSIYFSQISPIQSFESDELAVKHINGDIHLISLSDKFSGFEKGETKRLLFRANFWSLSETDALPNYIVTKDLVGSDSIARVIESTRVKIDELTGLEILPYVVPYQAIDEHFKRTENDNTKRLTAERLFQRNLKVNEYVNDVSNQIIPTPKSVTFDGDKRLSLKNGIAINWHNVDKKTVEAALDRLATFGIANNAQGVAVNLEVQPNNNKKIGSYSLTVDNSGIHIKGVDANGVFNGIQSLAALMTLGDLSVAYVEVDDEPHYAFRGILVDVARNFRSKSFIVKLMDQMAAYKMNKLHLHLGDDEGWRLEIPSLPELTEVSSKRCFDLAETQCLMPQLGAGINEQSPVNGFYSVADYQEILKEASKRHIQVIPSLDMPGHSRAAVKAMNARYQKYMALEQEDKAREFLLHDLDDKTVYSSVQYYNDNTINVCLESSYRFVEQVMKDVKNMHQQAGQPLTRYHIGADETAGAWLESPACKAFLAEHNTELKSAKDLGAYFVERIANMLAKLNIEAAAWIDGLEHTNPNNMPAVIQANAWHPLAWEGHKSAHKLANYNWQMVVSSPDVTYFDFPYEADPKEHGYYWAAREVNTQKLFNFMPDNLPIHAEFWRDREGNPYIADDTDIKDEQGKHISGPMALGNKFLGIQGQLWSENTRTLNTAEYKIFPRLLALAERGWHSASWSVPYNHQGFKYSQDSKVFNEQLKQQRDKAWYDFARTLGQKELAKLELANIHYRLPTVGAVIEDGILQANMTYPGIAIEYKVNSGDWQVYSTPVEVVGQVQVRAKSFDDKRRGRALQVLSN